MSITDVWDEPLMAPRVDAHHHIWDLSTEEHGWLAGAAMAPIRRTFTLADLSGPVRQAGVCGTVLVQVRPSVLESREFLALAAAADRVLGVVGWVDLTDPGVADAIAELRGGPGGHLLKGIRHLVQSEADPTWLARPDVRRGLRAVGDAGLAYDLLTVAHQLPCAVDTVRALPEVTFVVDHLSKPPITTGEREPWATHLRALAAAPNVYCKLSGMVTEADWIRWTVSDLRPYADVALDAFGAHRLMFGSDWPVCLLAGTYAQVVTVAEELCSALSATERAEVFGGTAVRAYRLAVPGGQV